MKRILIAYDTGYGTTAEIAGMIRNEFLIRGALADVSHVTAAERLTEFDALVVGSPIRLGRCTRGMRRFLHRNAKTLKRIPVAFYFSCISALRASDAPDLPFPVYLDPTFGDTSRSKDEMNLMERGHAYSYYLKHFLRRVPHIQPVAVAFFKGRLDLSRLSVLHTLIMKLAMVSMQEIKEGEFINPVAVRHWAKHLYLDQFSSDR